MSHYTLLHFSKYRSIKEPLLAAAVSSRIEEGYRLSKKIRQDAVRAIGVLMSGSHGRMQEIASDGQLFEAWQQANYAFACGEFGRDNIVRFTVHKDGKTPHIHCVFVPLTLEGRLSSKAYIGGTDRLSGYQDRYRAKMGWFGFGRGLSQKIPKRSPSSSSQLLSQLEADVSVRLRRAGRRFREHQALSSLSSKIEAGIKS